MIRRLARNSFFSSMHIVSKYNRKQYLVLCQRFEWTPRGPQQNPQHPQLCRFSSTSTVPTIREVRNHIEELVGACYSYERNLNQEIINRAGMQNYKYPSSQEDLPARNMAYSYSEVIIPLADDHIARDKYSNPYGYVRIGKLLEDLDTLAVGISYKHNERDDKTFSPLSIVTALVDKIDLYEASSKILINTNINMNGQVIWTGKSSMVITMKLCQKQGAENVDLLNATFVMVARNPKTQKAEFVNPIKSITSEEKKMFLLGEQITATGKKKSLESLFKKQPTNEEYDEVHQIFINTLDPKMLTFNTRIKPENAVWMEDTKLKTVLLCQPENRNIHNKIFGGFLMRQAFELAWINGCSYCSYPVSVTVVDDIVFTQPVHIGSLLYLSSQVVYTEGQYLQTRVRAENIDSWTGNKCTTNVFYFTFKIKKNFDIPSVVPKTYAEAMLYLDGKRHFLENC